MLFWSLGAQPAFSSPRPVRLATGHTLAGSPRAAVFSQEGNRLLVVTDREWVLLSSSSWPNRTAEQPSAYGACKLSDLPDQPTATDNNSIMNESACGTSQGGVETGINEQGLAEADHTDRGQDDSGAVSSSETAEFSGQRELAGGLLLDGWQCPQAAQLGPGIGALVWDRQGWGQLLWLPDAGGCHRVCCIQLPGACTAASISAGSDGSSILHASSPAQGQPVLDRIQLPADGKLGRWSVWEQFASGSLSANGLSSQSCHHTPDASSNGGPAAAVAGNDAVTVSMVARPGSHEPHFLLKVPHSYRICNASPDLN